MLGKKKNHNFKKLNKPQMAKTKLLFRNKGEIKISPDKGKLKEFVH